MIIADAHADTLWTAPRQNRDWSVASEIGHVDLHRLKETGVVFQVLALFSDPAHRDKGFTVKALEMWHTFFEVYAQSPFPLRLVLNREDVPDAGGHVSVLLSIEGGEALAGRIAVLDAFFQLGVRAMGLVWNGENELGHGVASAAKTGLKPFGRRVIERMEQLGMAVDVSHLNDAGFDDVAHMHTRPFYASHSNARALCPHPRNLTDAQIRTVAAAGGVIGINFFPPFLSESGKAQMSDVVAHIDHMAALVGPAHLCLGTDFDGISSTPAGLEDVTCLPRLADTLRQAGYGDEDVRGMMGKNLLRFFTQVLPSA